MNIDNPAFHFNEADLESIKTRSDLLALLEERGANVNKAYAIIQYEKELEKLQIELLKLQKWIMKHNPEKDLFWLRND